MKRIILLFVVLSFTPLAQALTPVEECVVQAEINIGAVEAYISNGAQFEGLYCVRRPKGGFMMSIYTDCGLDNFPDDFNNVFIHSDKAGSRCHVSRQSKNNCPQVPGAGSVSRTSISNKDLAAFKKVYRQRCRNWEPPTP